MKRHFATLAVVAALALTLASAHAQAPQPPLVIGRNSLDSTFTDVTEQVTLEAFRRADIAVRIVRLPLLRSIEMAAGGEIDGDTARAANVGERYPSLIVLTPPVIRADSAIYGRDPTLTQRTRAEIRRMSACVGRGSMVLRNHSAGMRTVEAPTREASLTMLAAARCDIAVVLHLDADVSIAQQQLKGLVRWPYRWDSEPLYLVLNTKHAALAPRLNQALAGMKADGTIDRYYADALRRNHVKPLESEPPR